MDIFNKREVERLRTENKRLTNDLKALSKKFETIANLEQAEPEGCKRGPWCKACEFVKPIFHREYIFGSGHTTTVYACGKGESCIHFIQKETNVTE